MLVITFNALCCPLCLSDASTTTWCQHRYIHPIRVLCHPSRRVSSLQTELFTNTSLCRLFMSVTTVYHTDILFFPETPNRELSLSSYELSPRFWVLVQRENGIIANKCYSLVARWFLQSTWLCFRVWQTSSSLSLFGCNLLQVARLLIWNIRVHAGLVSLWSALLRLQ